MHDRRRGLLKQLERAQCDAEQAPRQGMPLTDISCHIRLKRLDGGHMLTHFLQHNGALILCATKILVHGQRHFERFKGVVALCQIALT